ncbi:hypothetical protein [Bacillus mycoides]|uniref:hypothetical protein n=1 Tax=Bacillus mycoides TaxID=1405 RepID=UPI0010BE943D|nr:hypothetical protein [Bacillus mycoides]TKI39965.1 hypothetical protein FC700_20850 [Bacillus mycoides]
MLSLVVDNFSANEKNNKNQVNKIKQTLKNNLEIENDLIEQYIIDMSKEIEDNKEYQYPMNSDIDSLNKDAYWYTSPEDFGCWIINDCTKKLMSIPNNIRNELTSYYSPIPLHDHEAASKRLANHMCWYVDSTGLGKYCVLIGGIVTHLPDKIRK